MTELLGDCNFVLHPIKLIPTYHVINCEIVFVINGLQCATSKYFIQVARYHIDLSGLGVFDLILGSFKSAESTRRVLDSYCSPLYFTGWMI